MRDLSWQVLRIALIIVSLVVQLPRSIPHHTQKKFFHSEFIGNMLAINMFIANVKRNATIQIFTHKDGTRRGKTAAFWNG